MRTLGTLKSGESGVIRELRPLSPSVRRLADMGLTRGTKVVVLGSAPLGDPMILSVRGYRLALRRRDADSVVLV